MNIDWVKSVDSHNLSIISSENKFRLNAIISSGDVFDDKVGQKLDYRTNFSIDNENVLDEANKIVKVNITNNVDSLILLDHQYFLIQYISKHIQQYKILNNNIPMYIKFLIWIKDAALLLSNRIKLPKVNKEFSGELIKKTYEFCPHRSNCQINYGKKKGKCCAPHYVHNHVYYDINVLIKYFEKNSNSLYSLDKELFKILKQINTLQFVINQMYIELSSFKNQVNQYNTIEKYHHNCKTDEPKQAGKLRFTDMPELFDDEEEEEEELPKESKINLNVYRVWKD
jgi:hypothetical protein